MRYPRSLICAVLSALWAVASAPEVQGQLRRPGITKIKESPNNDSGLSEEAGAVYVEDLSPKPFRITINQTVPAYRTLKGKHWLGNVLAPQNGELVAISDRAYRVRAKAAQGKISGWIRKDAVGGLPPEFDEQLKAYVKRQEQVEQLIAEERVALGMTALEVARSLGPPDKRSSKITEQSQSETQEFIHYELVTETILERNILGQVVPVSVQRDVPAGKLLLTFQDGVLTEIEEEEGIDLTLCYSPQPLPRPVIFSGFGGVFLR